MNFATEKCTVRTPTGKTVEQANCTAGKATLVPKPVVTFSDVKASNATPDYGRFLRGEGRVVFMNAVNAIRAQVEAEEAELAPGQESWMTSVWIDVDGRDPHFPRPSGFEPHRLLVSAWMENANSNEWKITLSFRAFRVSLDGQQLIGHHLDSPFNQPKSHRMHSLQPGGASPNSPAAGLSNFGKLSYPMAARQEWIR